MTDPQVPPPLFGSSLLDEISAFSNLAKSNESKAIVIALAEAFHGAALAMAIWAEGKRQEMIRSGLLKIETEGLKDPNAP